MITVRMLDGRQRGELLELPRPVAETLIDRGWAIDTRCLMKVHILTGPRAGEVVELPDDEGEKLLRSGQAEKADDDAPALPWDGGKRRADDGAAHVPVPPPPGSTTPPSPPGPVLGKGEAGAIETKGGPAAGEGQPADGQPADGQPAEADDDGKHPARRATQGHRKKGD
jgi:hypothetical protein